VTRSLGLSLALLFALVGCVSVPNPLAPNLRGSIGSPSHGVLTDAISLPMKGPGFVRIHDNDVHFGTPRLVSTIMHAAERVAEESPGSPPLVIGDLSKKTGGHAEGHHSHRSGRDADLLYFATTPDGVPIESPGFVRFGPDGLGQVPRSSKRLAGKFIRLDVDREWLLIKSLIQTPDAEVQWMFVAEPLEALIIEHARALGEDPHLIWYAETVLQQPTDSEAHDDHMHLRLACSLDDELAGCEGGPRWPFLPAVPDFLMSSDEEVAALLEP
jgi:penicillin-insensitive murein endopeptidase